MGETYGRYLATKKEYYQHKREDKRRSFLGKTGDNDRRVQDAVDQVESENLVDEDQRNGQVRSHLPYSRVFTDSVVICVIVT